jgi:hypothetical protein
MSDQLKQRGLRSLTLVIVSINRPCGVVVSAHESFSDLNPAPA